MTTPNARTVRLGTGIEVPAVGQGTWFMGESAAGHADEVRALRLGLDLGMPLIDTAEMYGDGGAERVVGEAVAGRRDEAVIVSKVFPHNAGRKAARAACERSLRRIGTDYLDVYLLHWRGAVPLAETVEVFAELRREGKIREWGVSNLDTADMRELWDVPGGRECVTDQVLYHAGSRGTEYELLPWCREQGVPVMAYCPLAQGGRLRRDLLDHPAVQRIAAAHGATPAQVALAWVVREGDVIAVPKAAREAHVRENAAALDTVLSSEELAELDAAFPPPERAEPLDIM
ncbi:diketogulonate reductase-like aldo/keto reductase [Lipingzhangella halophila]|uniref:Diketogulonate reductase-like aldo/keto reductase n=1 Tax=Lipingzhangella halophila TaxID=1783352 RepID=A0A7W7REW9_9ACTN|nr:aldo/keto reductase [Lipingzhangella halophila]MBB4930739.1 diketogulonate reductase-like aldo/keto reductase [Lipingzhangella halophila]